MTVTGTTRTITINDAGTLGLIENVEEATAFLGIAVKVLEPAAPKPSSRTRGRNGRHCESKKGHGNRVSSRVPRRKRPEQTPCDCHAVIRWPAPTPRLPIG